MSVTFACCFSLQLGCSELVQLFTDMATVQGESKFCTTEPLLESLVWPIPVIKQEIKEEMIENPREEITEVWVKKEYEFPIKEEVIYEKYPFPLKTEELHIVDNEMGEDCSDANDATNNSMVFQCEECDGTYTSPRNLENHKKFCRGAKKSTVRVNAEEVTTDVQTLAKILDGKKTYCCELCNYRTNKTSQMKNHLTKHTGERPFPCDVCDKAFAERSGLTRHKRVHSEDKQYKCTECSYASNFTVDLKRHVTSHTGEKMFACKLCEFKTATSGSLTGHMRTHTDEKPYVCTQCEYKSGYKINLERHVQKYHGDTLFPCVHCDYKTPVKRNLNGHVKKKHPAQKSQKIL